MKINVYVGNASHEKYAEEICQLVYQSAQERGTGIAKRSPEYVKAKLRDGKSIIALAEDGTFAGYAYIETWSHTKFVANSGLIVAHQFRRTGLAKTGNLQSFQKNVSLCQNLQHYNWTGCDENQYGIGIQTCTFFRTYG